MNNPRCEYCGHANRAGAEVCAGCDFPLGGEGAAGWADPPASGPFASGAAGDGIPGPPFKGAGDVISPMLRVYRKHFTLVGVLVLVTTLPQSLLLYAIIGVTGVKAQSGGALPGGLGAGHLLLWGLSILASAVLSGALVYAVVDLQRAGRSSAGECLARGLKATPKVFLVTLLYSLVTGLGYLLLVVPGVIFSLMFAVCVPVAVVEGRGAVEALKRSKGLTDGYKGLIFMTFFLWGLLVAAVSWVVQWSFMRGGSPDLPTLLLQTAVLGMLGSTVHVLTVYVYLGLLRERRGGFRTDAFTSGPEVAAGRG